MNASPTIRVFPTLARRFAAGMIDAGIAVGCLPLAFLCVAIASNAQTSERVEPSASILLLQCAVLLLTLMWIYTVAFECSEKQATLGKQALKIKVVDDQGAPLNPVQSSRRFFWSVATLLLAGLPLLGCLSGRGQSYFEQWSKTLVVSRNATVADSRNRQQTYTVAQWWGSMAMLIVFAFFLVNATGPVLEETETAYRVHRTHSKANPIVAAVKTHHARTGQWPAHLREVNHYWHIDTLDAGEDADVLYTPGKITYAWRLKSKEGEKTEITLQPYAIACATSGTESLAGAPSPCGMGYGD